MDDEQDKIWNLLGSLPTVEPSSNFNALFWEKVRAREEKVLSLPPLFVFSRLERRLAYALASVAIIIGLTFIFQIKQEKQLSNLAHTFKNAEEMEMVRHFEVLKDFELVQNLELLQDYEVIENIDETTDI